MRHQPPTINTQRPTFFSRCHGRDQLLCHAAVLHRALQCTSFPQSPPLQPLEPLHSHWQQWGPLRALGGLRRVFLQGSPASYWPASQKVGAVPGTSRRGVRRQSTTDGPLNLGLDGVNWH